MPSFRLMHRVTGTVLSGYLVLSASQAEIDEANQRLKATGTPYRFILDRPHVRPDAEQADG